jgi:hypothetical protein
MLYFIDFINIIYISTLCVSFLLVYGRMFCYVPTSTNLSSSVLQQGEGKTVIQ